MRLEPLRGLRLDLFEPSQVRKTGITIASILFLAAGSLIAQSTTSWTLGPFVRPVDAPVIEPNPQAVFTDPITKKPVHWEALHTFNPGAIVRNGKVYVLYRAEDDSGTMVIGMHTSRLGMASSEDGIHFTKEPTRFSIPMLTHSRIGNGLAESRILA